MTRPIKARISLDALSGNLERVRAYARDSKILSVIKANAYGHGLIAAAHALSRSDGFALLDLCDAVSLRREGFKQDIVLLEGFFSSSELPKIFEMRISIVVHSFEQIEMLEACRDAGRVDVFLKINSGMHRLGLRPEMLSSALDRLKKIKCVEKIVLMSHFPTADEERGVSEEFETFMSAARPYDYPVSLANSAALIRYSQTRLDWVRPGIMLYGASPFSDATASSLGLKPAMTLASKIIAVQELRMGERVGYGGIFEAEKDMRIGIVACGYADGYPRHAPTGTPILVDGRRTRTLGRVSMDMLYVDLGPLADAGVGSDVVLWGEGLPVEEVAKSAGTISYELLCARAQRVPVEYF